MGRVPVNASTVVSPWPKISFTIISLKHTYPVPEVVRKYKISGKRVGKRLVKVQHFQKPVPLDGVQVAISECSDVGR